jgi:sugar O-acyltransferase (sialic acid O-acetyltransferase NeuD family)
MTTLRIFGGGIRAAVAADLVRWRFAEDIRIEGYYDDRRPAGDAGPDGYPILGTVEQGLKQMPDSGCSALVMLGTRASARGCEVFLKLRELDVDVISLVAPDAFVSMSARIGRNTLVPPGAYIGAHVEVGDMVTLHGGCIIEHHTRIGSNVFMGPGVVMAGSVTIGNHAFLGTACRLIPEASVGVGSVIGGGALVRGSIPPHVVAYGSPATVGREVRDEDEVPTPDEIDELDLMGFV